MLTCRYSLRAARRRARLATAPAGAFAENGTRNLGKGPCPRRLNWLTRLSQDPVGDRQTLHFRSALEDCEDAHHPVDALDRNPHPAHGNWSSMRRRLLRSTRSRSAAQSSSWLKTSNRFIGTSFVQTQRPALAWWHPRTANSRRHSPPRAMAQGGHEPEPCGAERRRSMARLRSARCRPLSSGSVGGCTAAPGGAYLAADHPSWRAPSRQGRPQSVPRGAASARPLAAKGQHS